MKPNQTIDPEGASERVQAKAPDSAVAPPAPVSPAPVKGHWLPAGIFLVSQVLVQVVALGSNLVALGVLPLHEVGLLSVQTALAAWLYFTHGGALNHLYNVLPALGGSGQLAKRREVLQAGVGAVVAIALPLSALVGGTIIYLYRAEFGAVQHGGNFLAATLLTVLGTQWNQVKECEVKSVGSRTDLARWNLLVASCGLAPLLLLAVAPAYEVFLYRAALGSFGVMAFVLAREGLALLRPRFEGILDLLRGGSAIMVSQIVAVLILQGERLLMARRYGVEVVGAMQLYFIIQTGAQLVPATAMNLWYPQARREPRTLPLATAKALRFSLILLGVVAVGAGLVAMGLEANLAGAKYQRAAAGLLAGSLLLPAFASTALLFTFMILDRVGTYIRLQSVVLGLQIAVYVLPPAGTPVLTLVAIRALILYGGLLASILLLKLAAQPPTGGDRRAEPGVAFPPPQNAERDRNAISNR